MALPQAQVAVLAAEPSVMSQGAGRQNLAFVRDIHDVDNTVFASQNRPLESVQPVAPHKQASVFAVTPSVFVQLGAAMHRQYSDEELHDVSEVDSVL